MPEADRVRHSEVLFSRKCLMGLSCAQGTRKTVLLAYFKEIILLLGLFLEESQEE